MAGILLLASREVGSLARYMEVAMKRFILASVLSAFAFGSALAQDATCATKAVGSDGKPLAGAAKAAFLKNARQMPASRKPSTRMASRWPVPQKPAS